MNQEGRAKSDEIQERLQVGTEEVDLVDEITKQEKALALAEEGAVAAVNRDMLAPVRAINALTAAVLLTARIFDRWATTETERRAR